MRRASVVFAILASLASRADGYEFWLRAQTIGQAYQLRDYQLVGPDLFLGRRLFTETLALRIWDIGDFSLNRRISHLPERGLRISWQSYLRIDHDFGDYTNGRITTATFRRDAIDVIPDLTERAIALDLLYGYLQLEGMFDDHLTLQIGRILADDGWGTTAYDGASAKVELPQPIAITANAGLRVRASSPLGTASYELDGTSGAGCQEYVEGPSPGSGTWKLIDRNRTVTNSKFSSDFEYCPQRDVAQPTLGVTIATSRVRHWGVEVGYRRTQSDTVGLIGPVDRLQYPDLGLYPNAFGQAPKTGINEERLYARAHGEFHAGDIAVQPYADARYSLLDAVFDRADAGVRLRRGNHVLEPSLDYFFPTFDGDSIFNVFSIEPTTDARLAYQYTGKVRATATAWLRRYAHEDRTSSFAGGATASLEHPIARGWTGRVDALWDDGYGGRRIGATGEVAWRPNLDLWLRGRVIGLDVRRDAEGYAQNYGEPAAVGLGSTVVSATWRVAELVALHGIAEVDYDAVHNLQTRVIAVLDLAFQPEP
jgi:hypothetical protein